MAASRETLERLRRYREALRDLVRAQRKCIRAVADNRGWTQAHLRRAAAFERAATVLKEDR